MRVNSRYMGQWGHDPVPQSDDENHIPSFKFMNLHEPVTDEFGGHYHLSGAWGVHFYGQDQAAVCDAQEQARKFPEQNENFKWHDIPGPNEFEPGSCNCGIHSQTLNNIHDANDFRMDTLAQLNMHGNTDYTDAGYRTSHGRVSKIWTAMPLDNDQVKRVERDLGAKVERVPQEFINQNGGYYGRHNADWTSFIDNTPELHNRLQPEKDMLKEWDRRSAAESLDTNMDPDHIPEEKPCPKCGSTDLGLTTNPAGHTHGRLGTCFNCGHAWKRNFS